MAIALACVTLVTYLPVVRYDFIQYDDPGYVAAHGIVSQGLTWQGIVYAFTSPHAGFWQPVTVLSHMLDTQLFGSFAGLHHFSSLVVHTANVVLLFLLLNAMTGAPWPSALVAALLALHPLNVESAAWIAERKSLLSLFFSLLTIAFYVRQVRAPSARWPTYAMFASFACALMSKAMAVTLPFVLLLLDVWPLNRWRDEGRGSRVELIMEKLPLFLLSAAACLLTFHTQRAAGAVVDAAAYPLGARLAHIAMNYTAYLGKMFWPAHLAVLYPRASGAPSPLLVTLAVVFLLAVTAGAVAGGRRFRYLPVGWFWYLGTLVPVIGIVMVGYHSIADRFAYLPLIGLFIMMAWGLADAVGRRPALRPLAVTVCAGVLVTLAVLTRLQLRYWRSSLLLFDHAIAATERNFVMHENLGREMIAANRPMEALVHFSEAVRIEPAYLDARANLALTLYRLGRQQEAIELLRETARMFTDDARVHCDLGMMLAEYGEPGEAAVHLVEALRIEPGQPKAHFTLARLLLREGERDKARAHAMEALRLVPDSQEIRKLLEEIEQPAAAAHSP